LEGSNVVEVPASLNEVHALESFEAFPPYRSPRFKVGVDRLLQDGYSKDGFTLPDLRASVPWGEYSRPFRFRLHSWEPIGDLLMSHSRLGDTRALDVAEFYAFDWLRTFQQPVLACAPSDFVAAQASQPEHFAWYDMAVGLRIYRLAYLAETIIRQNRRSVEDRHLLLRSLRFHHEVLVDPLIFRAHTNHGLYQALGQLAASRRLQDLLPSKDFASVARLRLQKCFSSQFFVDEGVHREHSPSYHHMVLGCILGAQEANLLDTDQDAFLSRAEEALMWMMRPDASLAPIGDTDSRPLPSDLEFAKQRRYPPLQNLLSRGVLGAPAPSGVRVYLSAGYAFARIYKPWRGERADSASYLAQLSGYHSRTHKHADHLSFVWSEGLLNILSDPGHFGYLGRTRPGDGLYEQGFWYSDPRRIYVESTRAHNCVEIDGCSYRRLNGNAFGSGLKGASQQGSLVIFDSSLTIQPSLLHRRILILAPREFLLVVDWLADRSTTRHDFRQWFQMAPSWSVCREGNGYVSHSGDAELHVLDLLASSSPSDVYFGQEEPLQGWTSLASGSLVPSASFNFGVEQTDRACFATLLSLCGRPTRSSATRINSSLSRAILAWRISDRSIRINLERGSELKVSLQVE